MLENILQFQNTISFYVQAFFYGSLSVEYNEENLKLQYEIKIKFNSKKIKLLLLALIKPCYLSAWEIVSKFGVVILWQWRKKYNKNFSKTRFCETLIISANEEAKTNSKLCQFFCLSEKPEELKQSKLLIQTSSMPRPRLNLTKCFVTC